MDNKSLSKGMWAILSANLVNLVFNLFINFAQPKFLSISAYAAIKTFQLYGTYAGILHLGFVDGVYLEFGGKRLNELSSDKISKNVSTLRIFQAGLSLLALLVGIVIHDIVLIVFAISIVPLNLTAYYRSLYQATGEFKKYGRSMNATTISAFLLNLVLIVFFKAHNYLWFLLLYFVSYVWVYILLERQVKKSFPALKQTRFNKQEFVVSVREGFFLMLGNFSQSILTSFDLWFVKILLNVSSFAYFSFAVSMENFLNVAITPITVTLYNFFCTRTDPEDYNRAKRYVIMFSVILPAAAFPAKFILERFLSSYVPSISVMFLLFSAQTFYVIVKGVYVNLYKAKGMQRTYFLKLVFSILASLAVNLVGYLILRNMEAFAIGTLLISAVWLFISAQDFPNTKITIVEWAYIFVCVIALNVFGVLLNVYIGFVLYLAVIVFMTFLVFNKDIKKVILDLIQK